MLKLVLDFSVFFLLDLPQERHKDLFTFFRACIDEVSWENPQERFSNDLDSHFASLAEFELICSFNFFHIEARHLGNLRNFCWFWIRIFRAIDLSCLWTLFCLLLDFFSLDFLLDFFSSSLFSFTAEFTQIVQCSLEVISIESKSLVYIFLGEAHVYQLFGFRQMLELLLDQFANRNIAHAFLAWLEEGCSILCSDKFESLRVEGRPSAEECVGAQDAVDSFEKQAEFSVVLVCDEQELLSLVLDKELDHGLVEVGHHRKSQFEDGHGR